MTRRVGAGLILLALWLQVLAPAGGPLAGATAVEAAIPDAVIHAVICGRDFDPDAGVVAATGLPAPSAACESCPLCRCTAVAPAPVAPEVAVRHLRWRPVAWPTPPPVHALRPPRFTGLARAPPRFV